MPLPAFLHAPLPTPTRRPRAPRLCPRMSRTPPLQERVLRLERALAAAVLQERYNDAASLRDALVAARHADPVLAKRAELAHAVETQDFLAAARLRDEIAALTERFSRAGAGRTVDRIIVLRGRGDPDNALRVATVSRQGDLQLGLVPAAPSRKTAPPRVYLQPTWSPSGDFVAMTEISFDLDNPRLGRGVAIADSASRIIIMNAFDGTVVKSAPLLKPPFFFYWSPDGRCVTLLSNDPTAPVTTVALSVLQVVAPPGAGGLDMEVVTGPLASGHPFLFDFCPRDSGRVVAHMGDKSAVAIVPVSQYDRTCEYLTKSAGSFGAPQWHPLPGKDGREVVLFVEHDSVLKDENQVILGVDMEEDDEGKIAVVKIEGEIKEGGGVNIESLLTSGGTLLQDVLRKGAESLGLTPPTDDRNGKKGESGKDASDAKDNTKAEASDDGEDNGKDEALTERFRRFLPKKPSSKQEEEGQEKNEEDWAVGVLQEQTISRLVMVDADNPKKKRTLARFSGVMAFKLSPDGSALATLVTNPATGQDELTLCTGNFCPDSVENDVNAFGFRPPQKSDNDADIILSTPQTRVLAFFWSPDGRKLLFLTSLRGSRVGAAQWATFDIDTNRIVRYEKFVISGIYMHCLNFFDQFGASMTPWSPESDAFCYPGRPLTEAELERETSPSGGSSPALSALFMQRDSASDGKRFSARVQNVPTAAEGKATPDEAVTIVENVEYACWSPC